MDVIFLRSINDVQQGAVGRINGGSGREVTLMCAFLQLMVQ